MYNLTKFSNKTMSQSDDKLFLLILILTFLNVFNDKRSSIHYYDLLLEIEWGHVHEVVTPIAFPLHFYHSFMNAFVFVKYLQLFCQVLVLGCEERIEPERLHSHGVTRFVNYVFSVQQIFTMSFTDKVSELLDFIFSHAWSSVENTSIWKDPVVYIDPLVRGISQYDIKHRGKGPKRAHFLAVLLSLCLI